MIYSFPLPRDAALRAFRITGDGFEAHSELKPTEEAVRAYEQNIAEGSLSTLLDHVAVLDPSGNEILTLVTCYPFYFVGSAPDRFIVQAERVT